MFVVVMLAIVAIAVVPASAQDGAGLDVITTEEESVTTCAWGPTEVSSPENPYAPDALDASDHSPGEFLATYYSEEEMWAASQENVVSTKDNSGWYYPDTGITYYPTPRYMQTLHFEDIASIPDPCERFAAEEAKRQEILAWPGVKYAGYNGYFYVENDAEPSEVGTCPTHH